MVCNSSIQVLGPFPSFSQVEIQAEISQARVPISEARNAGPAHRTFIAALPMEWQQDPSVEIFSRLLFLKEGWYPLGPYYHCDWSAGPSGPCVETLMVLLGGASRTEFVIGPVDLPDERPGIPMEPRRDAHVAGLIEEGVRSGRLQTYFLEPEQLVLFDNQAWHRARPATETGWRLLMRAIRGLPKEGKDGSRYKNPGRFTTLRNGYVPETPEERMRYEPYRV